MDFAKHVCKGMVYLESKSFVHRLNNRHSLVLKGRKRGRKERGGRVGERRVREEMEGERGAGEEGGEEEKETRGGWGMRERRKRVVRWIILLTSFLTPPSFT